MCGGLECVFGLGVCLGVGKYVVLCSVLECGCLLWIEGVFLAGVYVVARGCVFQGVCVLARVCVGARVCGGLEPVFWRECSWWSRLRVWACLCVGAGVYILYS